MKSLIWRKGELGHNCLITSMLVSWLFMNLYLLFVAFWPDDVWPLKCIEVLSPIQIIGDRVENGMTVIHPGDPLRYRVHFKKYTNKPAMISRQILNERIFNYADIPSNLSKGEDCVVATIVLPLTATPDHPHTLVWSATYKNVIPLRDVTVRSISQPFMVREKQTKK